MQVIRDLYSIITFLVKKAVVSFILFFYPTPMPACPAWPGGRAMSRDTRNPPAVCLPNRPMVEGSTLPSESLTLPLPFRPGRLVLLPLTRGDAPFLTTVPVNNVDLVGPGPVGRKTDIASVGTPGRVLVIASLADQLS